MEPFVLSQGLPTTLVDLLSNSLILQQTAPYLPVSSLCALSSTSKALYDVIRQSPEAFRYLDLSPVRSAIVPFDGPLDGGGISWRAERMDEALSEDDFYSGPLRGIVYRLEKQRILRNVHTFVLDGLSVTAEFVKELITEDRYNVRLLSVREVKHLNERKLQQYLRYAVRPSRPEGTPRVKGIYMFGPRERQHEPETLRAPPTPASRGIMSSQGAQIGAEWNQKSSEALNTVLARTEDRWYQSSGKMITKRPSPEWAEIIGVRRDCFGCGHTCISCKELFIRQCKKCQNEYCKEDNDASSETLARVDKRTYTDKMVGKKSGRAQLRQEGLERTDNNMDLSSWPQVGMINQKNYYTEFLKRDEQFLAVRYPKDEERARIVQEARDKDRARALGVPQAAEGTTPQADEPADEADVSLDSSKTDISKLIVIHPGSQNLRIGLGSDALPKTIPMVIARRWKESECEENGGEPSPKRMKIEGAVPADALPEKWFGEDFADQYMAMSSELRTRMRSNKRRVLPNSKDLVTNYNRRTPPDVISEHNDINRIEFTEIPADPKKAPHFFTGHDALRIPERSNPRYKLFWPLRHGTFNEAEYKDRNQIYHDISKIFEEAIRNQLGVTKMKDLANYKCVLIIPDLYERNYVTMLLDILIRDLCIGKVCLQQESLSITFGAGSDKLCVVDIGAQKTSICCVDEGLCVEESRVNLKMGGADITETFIKMMLYGHFPYSDINLKRRYDFLLAEELKQKFCSMDESTVVVQTWDFHLRAAGQETRKYMFKTYDETLLSVMGLLKPSIFDNSHKLEGRRSVIPRSVDLYDSSPNDPLSAAQLVVLELAGGRVQPMNGTEPTTVAATPQKPPSFNLLNRLVDNEATPRSSVAGSPGPEGTPNPDRDTPLGDTDAPAPSGLIFRDPVLEKVKIAEERDRTLPIMSLDAAILESLAQGGRGDEKKMRDFMGGIVLVGGVAKTPGLREFLELRLRELRPGMEILLPPPPRDLDPQVIAWKGGSVTLSRPREDGLKVQDTGSHVDLQDKKNKVKLQKVESESKQTKTESGSAKKDTESELTQMDSEDLSYMQQNMQSPSEIKIKRGPGRPQGSPSSGPYGYWKGVSYAEKQRLLADQAAGIPLPEKTVGPRKGTKQAIMKSKTQPRRRD
ncbi:actin-like protein arp8 [Didymella keratinophila]|nr:actin-like protein arp8 [Didymella keratinophila]